MTLPFTATFFPSKAAESFQKALNDENARLFSPLTK
jgi:hypothetical protein